MAFRIMAFQVFAKNDGCSYGVHSEFSGVLFLGCAVNLFRFAPEFFLEQALGFPTGQPFVRHFDGNANLLVHAFGEALGFFGHFAVGAIEAQRKSDQNQFHRIVAHQFAQAAHVFIAIDPFERAEGLSHTLQGFRDGQANAGAAVVQSQNFSGGMRIGRRRNGWGLAVHMLIISFLWRVRRLGRVRPVSSF